MANQIIVTQNGNVQVSIQPTPNVQVQISRAAIGTVSNVPTANFANYAGNVTVSAQPNITSLGTLTGLTVNGNSTVNNLVVTGNLSVGNLIANSANYANFAGIVVNNNQPNITSVGTLTGLSVAGNIIPTSNIAYDLGNNTNRFNDLYLAGNTIYLGQQEITANASSVSFTGNLTGNATGLSNIPGANVTGQVPFAATANSVALANVSGAGNIASLNLDGNASNVLYGNGSFSALPTVSNVANANYANFAGTAFNVSGSNVTGAVANATFANSANTANSATVANSANSVAGANVSGTVANATYAANAGNATIANSANSVAVANVSGIGNIATTNYDGNASNVLYGNGGFYALPTVSNVANANYANFAGTAFNVSGSNVSGEVANAAYANAANTANLATFATTANAVAGANVSGEVANANFASYANIASSANSVALANVVGIGNIANINLDGSSSNVLYGNGQFATITIPAGDQISNGTSNVNIPVANGNVNISTNGNANIAQFDTNGALFLYPTTSSTNGLRINSYGNPIANDVSRIASFRARGNATTPLSVQPNDALMRLLAFGHNGNIQQTSSTGSLRAIVDSSYTANGANIPIGWQILVNDTNGGVNNQTRTHNFWSNGNVSLNRALVVDTDITTNSGNITATSGVFNGNGSGLTNITGANVTGTVANATYAANAGYAVDSGTAAVANSVAGANVSGQVANALVAGTVYTNAQPNITSVGNLTNLNVVNSANVTGAIQQLAPNTITISTNSLQNTAYNLTTLYGETGNLVESTGRSIIRSRGNVSAPAAVVVNDNGSRDRVYFYNGTTNALGFSAGVNLTNLNSNSNAYTTGASYNISVGAPSGDQNNPNAASALNLLQFTQNGQLVILPGSTSTVGAGLTMFSYGQNTNLAQSQGITLSKARGNRDANLSVNAGDTIGRILFQSYNGNAFVTNRLPIIRATVDSTYVANAANVPAGLTFIVCDSNTSYTHNFSANGAVTIGGALTSSSLNTGNIFSSNINTGTGTIAAGNTFLITLDNNQTQAILQQTYNNANIQTGTWTSWRHRGNASSPLPVQAGDEISKFSSVVRADSGNVYYDAAEQAAVVISNDGAGNVATDYRIRVYNSGSKFSVMAPKLTVADSNDFGANATIYANGYIDTIGRLEYLRTFGSFTSNATQTNSNVGNAVYMTLNNTEDANGVSIVSSSQITVARTGRYNIQFSAQIEKTDTGTDEVEIWLVKNGTPVANSATRLAQQGNNEKGVAAWNWLDNATTANTYYQIAWASTDANMQITAIDSANTLSGVAIPSLIVTVVPVGA
jgi:hypothetical protein